jgi:hypothetical protein
LLCKAGEAPSEYLFALGDESGVVAFGLEIEERAYGLLDILKGPDADVNHRFAGHARPFYGNGVLAVAEPAHELAASTREVMICTQYTSVVRVRGGGLTADVGVVLSVAAAIGGCSVVVAVGMATRISGAGGATSTIEDRVVTGLLGEDGGRQCGSTCRSTRRWRASASAGEDVVDDGDQCPQQRRSISRVVREPHLDFRRARAQRSTHDAGSAEPVHGFPRQKNAAAGGDEAEGGVEPIALVDDLRFQAGLAADLHERIVVSGRKTP